MGIDRLSLSLFGPCSQKENLFSTHSRALHDLCHFYHNSCATSLNHSPPNLTFEKNKMGIVSWDFRVSTVFLFSTIPSSFFLSFFPCNQSPLRHKSINQSMNKNGRVCKTFRKDDVRHNYWSIKWIKSICL